MTFDAWEGGVYCPDDVLMHWGIPGMKHGRRRYQNEDGTWTEQGLAERRKREGFGESRAERKAERKAARAERKEARKAARAKAMDEWAEKRRQKNVKNLTDEEIRSKIERMKLEQEYREMAKSPALKLGEKLVTEYLKNHNEKLERAYNEKQTKLTREFEMAKLKEQTEQTKLRAEADKARASADKTRAETDRVDIEKGTRMKNLKNQAQSNKLQAKRWHSDYTILGGMRKLGNKILSGRGDQLQTEYRAVGESNAAMRRGLTDARIAKRQNKILTRRNRKLDPWEAKAEIQGGSKNYFESQEPREKQQKKKKGKNGGDNS